MLTGELEKEHWVPPIGCIQSVYHNNETPLENKGKSSQTTNHFLLLQNYKQPSTFIWGDICLGSHLRFPRGASCFVEGEGIRRINLIWQQWISQEEVTTIEHIVPRNLVLSAQLTTFLAMSSGPTSGFSGLIISPACLEITARLYSREFQPWGDIWPLLSGSVDLSVLNHSAPGARAGSPG